MEYLHDLSATEQPVQAVLFDFDGTVSTLRFGWEAVMRRLMIDQIYLGHANAQELAEIDAYIDESTGIQTIHQMKWLVQKVIEVGRNPQLSSDPWYYKKLYNDRLMENIAQKKQALISGQAKPEEYLIAGSVTFLKALRQRNVKLYVASGTDHPDVCQEARALGVYDLFDRILGAPLNSESCSKEKVMADLIREKGLCGRQVAVIGDGKVEIALGKQAGAITVGLATDEAKRFGVNAVKRERLVKAGADVICGDFLDEKSLLQLFGLQ